MSDQLIKTTFTLAEAAALLSCHPETLRRAIRKGQLQAAKLGRGFRISRADLEAFWTASGGGTLFDVPLESGQEGEPTVTPSKPEKKPDTSPRQLSLLGQVEQDS